MRRGGGAKDEEKPHGGYGCRRRMKDWKGRDGGAAARSQTVLSPPQAGGHDSRRPEWRRWTQQPTFPINKDSSAEAQDTGVAHTPRSSEKQATAAAGALTGISIGESFRKDTRRRAWTPCKTVMGFGRRE